MRHNFREMNIWKKSMDITKEVYKLILDLPIEEKYGLKSQISRSAVSIPSNIAEGSGRTTVKDFSRFIDISLSSSYELETQLILSHNLFGMNIIQIVTELNELQKMIGGFKRSLINK